MFKRKGEKWELMKHKTQLLNEHKDDYIPNIDLGQAYDQHYIDTDIHYESLEKLANFLAVKCQYTITTGFINYM